MLWGLPELTRYFLVSEGIEPTTLFDHCKPKSLEGLYITSVIDPRKGVREEGEEPANEEEEEWDGHDGTVLYGGRFAWVERLLEDFPQTF